MKQKFHDRLVFDGGCGNVDVENNGRFQPSVSHSFNLGCEDIPVENKVQGQGKVFFPFSFSSFVVRGESVPPTRLDDNNFSVSDSSSSSFFLPSISNVDDTLLCL